MPGHILSLLFPSIFLFPHPARFESGPSPLSHSPFLPGGSSAPGLSESGQGTCVCWRGDPGKRHHLSTSGAKARFCPIQKQEHETRIPDQVAETAWLQHLSSATLGASEQQFPHQHNGPNHLGPENLRASSGIKYFQGLFILGMLLMETNSVVIREWNQGTLTHTCWEQLW